MRYLVRAAEGPSFTSVEEMIPILKNIVLPGLDAVTDLEAQKTILAGGLPVGERALAFIIEAPSNEDLDVMLQKIPLWGLLTWEVTPLQSFKARADHERAFVAKAKKGIG
jgi:muconolactone delta-isomerase